MSNFSVGEKKYFKGVVYNELPHTMRNFFIELNDEKREVDAGDEKAETASVIPKTIRRKKHGKS